MARRPSSAEFQKRKIKEAEGEASAASAKPSKEEEAKTTKEEVVLTTKEAPDEDENTANENIAETSNGVRVSVINVVDKTLGDDIDEKCFLVQFPQYLRYSPY